MITKLSVSSTLTLKKPNKNSALPLLVVFCDDTKTVLGDIDEALAHRATSLIKVANFKGELGENITDYAPYDATTPALCVVGTGKLTKLANNIDKVAEHTYRAIKAQNKAVIIWGNIICQQHFGQFVRALLGKNYHFSTYKKTQKNDTISVIEFVNNKDDLKDYQTALAFAQAVVAGQNLARDVANEPPNVCTPSHLAKQAKQLGKEYSEVLTVNVLDEKKMQKLGMGCFLAVSQGSLEEGKLVVAEYFGKTKKSKSAKLNNPVALVGKGLTFDSGGISIKPAAGMDEMKFDMGGAAAMLGTLKAVCEARLPIDIVVVLACAENMPSGSATRPGDVVTAMNGTTVEVLNTDAEGRLVLCDALCYVQDHYTPSTIIDAATLTGAAVIALGDVRSAVYSNDEDTLVALEAASDYTNDLIWQMPLDDDYAEQIKSPIADLANVGGRKGGSITAAAFLKHFIKEGQAWAHLDIAGTAWVEGANKGATGRPVPLLMQYLKTLNNA